MGQGILGPVLPLFARELGFGAAAAGAAVGSFALARLLFNVPLGALSDTKGRRFLIVGGPAVVAVGMVGSGLAPNLAALILWRFVAGVGSSMYMTGSLAYVIDLATPANRTRLLAINQGALLVGVSIGPWLGGVVGAEFGLRTPFFVVAGCALFATLYGFFRMPETVRSGYSVVSRAGRRRHAGPGMKTLLTAPFIAIAFANFAHFLTRGSSTQALIPLAATDIYGMSVDAIGLLLGVMALMSLVLLPLASTVADRFGRPQVIVPSLGLMAMSLAVVGLASTTAVFITGAILLGLGNAVGGPAPSAYAAEVSSPRARGMAMGAFRTAGDLGLLIGPPALGALADSSGYPWALSVNAIVMVAAAVAMGLVAFFPRR